MIPENTSTDNSAPQATNAPSNSPTKKPESPGKKEPKQNLINDLKVLKVIHRGRNMLYLAHSPTLDKDCCLKVFPFKEDKPCNSFLSESRFIVINNPNIIKIYDIVEKQPCQEGKAGEVKFSSVMLMEYAGKGDLSSFYNKKAINDQVLVRTWFHQLLSAVDHLHKKKIAHLDIKMENLLINDAGYVKLADFDLAYVQGDTYIRSKGSPNYRAPELQQKNVENPSASDIYSIGVCLFVMVTGHLPYIEDKLIEELNLQDLMFTDMERFWKKHTEFGSNIPLTDRFKELLSAMVCKEPEKRVTLAQIRQNLWFNGPIYSDEELKSNFSKYCTEDSKVSTDEGSNS